MAQQTFEEIVAAVKQAESRGKRYAADGKTLTTSPKGALGEMQVMPKTILDPGFGVAPAKDKSPDEIARVGKDYLQAMKQKYGDTEKALIAYNWGPGSTDKWIAAGANPDKLPQETKTYVERVKGLLGKNVSRETQQAKTEPTPAEEIMTKALPAGTTASVSRETMRKGMPDVKAMPASYQAAFALAALADAQDEEDDKVYNENKETESEKLMRDYKPVNHLASLDLSVTPIMMKDGGDVSSVNRGFEEEENVSKPFIGNPNISRQAGQARRNAAIQKASYRDEVAEAKDTARKGEAYQELEQYLQSRNAVPDIKVTNYLPEGTHGLFSSDRTNIATGTIKVNKNVPEMFMPSTIAHEMTHAADRQMMQQAKEQGMFGNGNQFTEAYEKMVGPEGRNRTQLLRKRYPEFEEDNRYYRADPKELAAHAIGTYSGPAMQDGAPRHVDATAATEFQILMELAQRNVDKGPKGLAKIPAFFKRIGSYADGGEVEQERLTPQQIERLAAQETADREAASNAAFIAQKSGIGRKEGNISKALRSGEGQVEFAKGMTNIPQNILGAPMDISNMVAGIYGGNVEKPFMGSEYLKEKSRAAGLGFTPSEDPTLAGFYGAGDLGSNLVNPAGVTRAGVQAAGKTGEAAKMLGNMAGQEFNAALMGERPGTIMDMLTAPAQPKYAVRNKGTPVAMSGLPFKSFVDEAEDAVNAVKVTRQGPLDVMDKPLGDWFSKKLTRYLRSDFATPDDQLVRAAEEGKVLHLAPKQFSDSAEDEALKHFLGRRQSDLEYMRQAEGFGKSNMATTPYGQRIEDLTDISAYPERVGDLTPNRVPQGMRDIVETRPETRVTDFAPGMVDNLKLNELRDKMLEVRQSNSLYGAYGQPAVKIPKDFLLPDKTLTELNVAAASNRMAKYTNWQDETRQRMATTSLRTDPRFTRAPLEDGKYLGVALPDVRQNPEVKQLVLDVGCDGGWCTRYSQNAKAYGSGDSRLHIMVTGEGKKARPVAQFAITDSGPAYDAGSRFSIREIKEKGNTTDFKNNPALPAIQEYVKFLDKSYGGLFHVDELKGLNMVDMRETIDFSDYGVSRKNLSKEQFGAYTDLFHKKLVELNGDSYFIDKNKLPDLVKTVRETIPTNAARQIQMNLFQPPKEKATGGMIERQPNDNRRYL